MIAAENLIYADSDLTLFNIYTTVRWCANPRKVNVWHGKRAKKRHDAGASATRAPKKASARAMQLHGRQTRLQSRVSTGLERQTSAHDRHSRFDFVDSVYGNVHVLTVHRDAAMDIDRVYVCVLCKHWSIVESHAIRKYELLIRQRRRASRDLNSVLSPDAIHGASRRRRIDWIYYISNQTTV